MKSNFGSSLELILKHEGGFVDHPKDPGGATNKGITIGTLRKLGIDVDGDGDSDLADLKSLRPEHVARVYKLFYWDAVKGDDLPSGVDLTVFDFAVNSGPSRAIKHLQKAVGVSADGTMGPKTLAAARVADPLQTIDRIRKSRLDFLSGLAIWPTFKKGWTRRVRETHAASAALVAGGTPRPVQPEATPSPVGHAPATTPAAAPHAAPTWLRALLDALSKIFRRKA